MGDEDVVPRWTICGRCHAVGGGPIGTVDGVTVWQLCDCVPTADRATQPRVWDLNVAFELCRACGLELLPSGSRWSGWFCRACLARVKDLNQRCGRCVVPIGRHSLMNGVASRGTHSEELDLFVHRMWGLFAAQEVTRRWARTVVRANLVAAGLVPDADNDVTSYLAAVRRVVGQEQRFNEMMTWLASDDLASAPIGATSWLP